jgi:hypothetical protein
VTVYTLSISKGDGNSKHNTRTQPDFPPNADGDRLSFNITLKDSNLREVYAQTFGEALEKYNAKQKAAGHPGRQIKDYYSKIAQDKRQKPFYEIVIMIGNKDHQPDREKTNEAFKQYFLAFEKNNPGMIIVGAYIHNDEATPHMHLDYVPVVTGGKNGLETHINNDKAIKQMGFSSWQQWQQKQFATMEHIMAYLGMQREIAQSDHTHLSVPQYKAAAELYQRQLAVTEREYTHIEKKAKFLSKDKVTVSTQEFLAIDAMKLNLTGYLNLLEQEQRAFDQETKEKRKKLKEQSDQRDIELKNASSWKEKALDLEKENGSLRDEVQHWKDELESTKAMMNVFRERSNNRKEELEQVKDQLQKTQDKLNTLKDAFIEVLQALAWILRQTLEKSSPFHFKMPEHVQNVAKAMRLKGRDVLQDIFVYSPISDQLTKAKVSEDISSTVRSWEAPKQADQERLRAHKQPDQAHFEAQKQKKGPSQNVQKKSEMDTHSHDIWDFDIDR